MTEEIIEVNGLNVTRCIHLSDCLLCDYTENHSQFCSDYDNCYYKQLKQAENTVNECHKYLAELEDKIESLEQERDELKFENDRYKQLLKGCPTEDEDCGLCVIDEQNKRLKQENKELKEVNAALIQKAEDVAEARIEICNQCGNRDNYNISCKMIRDLDYDLNITIKERNNYRSALEEIKNDLKEVCKEEFD